MELIDLLCFVTIFYLKQLYSDGYVSYSDHWLWQSQSCSFGFICFFWRCLFYNDFPSVGKIWSRCCFSFHWLFVKLTTRFWGIRFIAQLMTILVLIGTVFAIIWEIINERISLNLVLLMLLVHFVSWFRFKLM